MKISSISTYSFHTFLFIFSAFLSISRLYYCIYSLYGNNFDLVFMLLFIVSAREWTQHAIMKMSSIIIFLCPYILFIFKCIFKYSPIMEIALIFTLCQY